MRSRAAQLSRELARVVDTFLARSQGAARSDAAGELALLAPRLPAGPRLALAEAAVRSLDGGPLAAAGAEGTALLENFLRRLPPSEAVAAIRRAAASGMRLSPHTLRLGEMLDAAAREADPVELATPQATAMEMQRLEALFREADIDQVAPELAEAPRALDLPRARDLPPGSLPDLGPRRDTLAPAAVAAQLLPTLLELVAGRPARQASPAVLARLEDLYRELLENGRFVPAMQIVEELKRARVAESQDDRADALRRVLDRLGNREAVHTMLRALRDLPDEKLDEAAKLVLALGPPALRHLLGLLSEEEDRSLRHRLMGVLTALGPAVVGEATLLLQDSRWFVVRNMIVLLRAVNDETSMPQLRRLAEHQDLRVRLEAIKSLLAADDELPADLLDRAVNDPDPKLAESAIALAGTYGIAQATIPLLGLLAKPDRLGRRRAVRLRALRTLGELGQAGALPELDRLFLRDRWFRRAQPEERAAAFRALAGFPAEARKPYVERGLKSRDAAVRATCRAILEGKLRAPERESPEEAR